MQNSEIKIDLNSSKNFLYDNAEKIEIVIRRAIRKAILEHKRAGNPIAVSDESSNVVWIQPKDIRIGNEED